MVHTKEDAERYVREICSQYPYLLNMVGAVRVAQQHSLDIGLIKELAIRVITEAMIASTNTRFDYRHWMDYAFKAIRDYGLDTQEVVEAGIRALEKEIVSEQIVIGALKGFVSWRIGQLQAVYHLSSTHLREASLRAVRTATRRGSTSSAQRIKSEYNIPSETLQDVDSVEKKAFGLPHYIK